MRDCTEDERSTYSRKLHVAAKVLEAVVNVLTCVVIFTFIIIICRSLTDPPAPVTGPSKQGVKVNFNNFWANASLPLPPHVINDENKNPATFLNNVTEEVLEEVDLDPGAPEQANDEDIDYSTLTNGKSHTKIPEYEV